MENYFDLYNIPVQFQVDKAAVRRKFLELSRVWHPDRAVSGGAQAKEEALRMSAVNNKAYQVLNDEDATLSYILKLKGVLEEEEKYSLPPAFLMEMMELNEAVSEYEEVTAGNKKEMAIGSLEEQLLDWHKSADPVLARFDAGEQTDVVLKQIKDFYFRKKYLLRIKERLNTFASR